MKQPLPHHRPFWIGLVLFALAGIVPASGQEADGPSDADRFFPRQGFMLTGYGGAGYNVLLADGETVEVTFTAPTKPGEYPFICSFPGHYVLMRGVMKVT